jgi:hypothetical protein
MYAPSALILSHLAAFAALTSAQGDSQYAASVLSAIVDVDPSALASASANLESSVLSALAEPTADQNAIISNIESEISAVIYTIDQFTATADPSLLSSIEAQASAVGLDFDFESDIGQLTAAVDGPEETGGVGGVSTTDVDPEETSSLVVISAATSTSNDDSGETSSLVVISAATSAATSSATSTSDNAADSSSSSSSVTSQADGTSASSSSSARSPTQAQSSSSDAAAPASTSDNIAAAATSLPIAAVGAGLVILAML